MSMVDGARGLMTYIRELRKLGCTDESILECIKQQAKEAMYLMKE